MATRKQKEPETDIQRLRREVGALKDRCLYLERAMRIIGQEFKKTHLSEIAAEKWAKRANHLSNAMAGICSSLKRYGNEFDKPPYMIEPDNDWQD